VLGGDNVLIAGLIITGNEAKRVVLRAIGPSLAPAGVSSTLADPVLHLYDVSSKEIATNDDWQSDRNASEIQNVGLAPTRAAEAATLQSLPPGSYTVVVEGKNGGTGTALVEAYDISATANATLANISTRGFVGAGDQVMIGGFIVGGPPFGSGSSSGRYIVRAIGPSLTRAGIANPLADPTLEVYDGNGQLTGANNNWQDSQAAEIRATGVAPQDDREAALLGYLPSGPYTAVIRGANGSTGVALVEIYNLP
jgi:hypothetical protein